MNSRAIMHILASVTITVSFVRCSDPYTECTIDVHCSIGPNKVPECDPDYVWEYPGYDNIFTCILECGSGHCEAFQDANSCPEDCDSCGNRICTPLESVDSCPEDCAVCGDAVCSAGESPVNCARDCAGCGDEICQTNETARSCPKDCDSCGNGYCGPNETEDSCIADCDTCGNSICGPEETSSSCVADCCIPDCSGRQCGPDPVCGTNCGSCDDGNICTDDSCSPSGQCTNAAQEDHPLACSGILEVRACVGGEETTRSCAQECEPQGANGTLACDSATLACECLEYSSPTACTVGTYECTEGGGMVTCLRGSDYGIVDNFWYFRYCKALCRLSGFAKTTGCGQGSAGSDACFCDGRYCEPPCGSSQICVQYTSGRNGCCTPDCDGKSCGSDGCGGSCGGCGGNGQCVERNDGSAFCQCRSDCKEGSVCCGGLYCGGDCLYHYSCGCSR